MQKYRGKLLQKYPRGVSSGKKERKKGKTKRTNELEIACTNGWLKNRKERQKEGKSKKERMNELINASKKNVVLIILK